MLVSEAMTRTVVTITPEESLRDAARRLTEHAITAMPVIGHDGRVVGVVSSADLVRDSLVPDQRSHLVVVPVAERPTASYVVDVMTTLPVVVAPETDLAEAAQLMTERSVKSLPVVQDGRLVGIVSRTDVVARLARRDERVEAEIDDLVRSSGMGWVVTVVDGVVTLDGPVGTAECSLARAVVSTVAGVVGVHIR